MKLSGFSKITANLGLVLLGLGLIFGTEGFLRLVGFGDEYEFVIKSREKDHPGKACLNSQYVAVHYFRHLPVRLTALLEKKPWFHDTEFSIEKKPDTYRIFTVGASTTRGFPFEGRTINYSRFLEMILQDVLPDTPVEVVNAGYDALSSFGVLDLLRQIANLKPDLVVVYSGHNEFIGHFGVNSSINYGQNSQIIDLITRLFHTRLFLAGELASMHMEDSQKIDAGRDGRVNLFRAMLAKDQITWNQELHQKAAKHYKENLQEMVRVAQEAGAQIILATPVSNLRDFSPIQSEFEKELPEELKAKILKSLQEAKGLLARNDPARAEEILKSALMLDSGYAETHFYLARAYEAMKRFGLARMEYEQAREQDRVHLRACLELNRVVHSVGQQFDVPVLNLVSLFEKMSPHGLVGESLFLEHVHLNINGHILIADGLARLLSNKGWIRPTQEWRWDKVRSASHYVKQAGWNAQQMFQSQYTVGRLLLDFPFHKCEQGATILRNIGKESAESELIRDCYRILGNGQEAQPQLQVNSTGLTTASLN